MASLGQAELSTPQVFSNHMVIQRGLPAPVWGWSTPGSEVSVSFAGQTKQATTNAKGRWQVKLAPLKANNDGQAMEITDKSGGNITFKDVLIGDVWICSGQSNMEWPVSRSLNPEAEIAQAKHPQIRLFDVAGHELATKPADKLVHPSDWKICSPQSVPTFSGVGYYFGRELQQQSGVPIGLLGTNWGGTKIEPWTPPVGFHSQTELAALAKKIDSEGITIKNPKSGRNEPTAIYNAMVAPIVGFGVRGAIWYQGESNSGERMAYLPKLKALVEGWRSVWKQPDDFPLYFYVVKLAQFRPAHDNPQGGDGFAEIRIAQDRIQELPHTGVASAIDIGQPKDIHPKNKQDVGKRLARLALRDVYGKKDIATSGPTFQSFKVNGNTAVVSFGNLGGGLMVAKKEGLQPTAETPDAALSRFAVSGADKKWHWADAKIVGDTVELSAEAVAKPIAIRYAYSGNPQGANLYNKAGLPAMPFATDVWQP